MQRGAATRGPHFPSDDIMVLTGTAQYALRAVLYVAKHGVDHPVRGQEVADALGLPRNYLSKTLHILAQGGILRSVRGPRGGFRLAGPASEFSLARVVSPIEDVAQPRCLLGRPSCSRDTACPVHARWEAHAVGVREFFQHTTIADLLGTGFDLVPAPKAPRRARSPRASRRAPATPRRGAA